MQKILSIKNNYRKRHYKKRVLINVPSLLLYVPLFLLYISLLLFRLYFKRLSKYLVFNVIIIKNHISFQSCDNILCNDVCF